MKIYTKTGDAGQTSLASGQRVSKTDARLEAYGTADELNAFVGLLRSGLTAPKDDEWLAWIQHKLFNLGAALAEAKGDWIAETDVEQLERWIDEMQKDLPPLRGFVLPAGSEQVSYCHVCRTVTRRLERNLVGLTVANGASAHSDKCTIDENRVLLRFVNRLSDFWFVFAQKIAKKAGIELFFWKK